MPGARARVILAQMGSYVPAERAEIGVIDKLFSRVGAADDLARGRSTFMVEMVETAAILSQATERSFVIGPLATIAPGWRLDGHLTAHHFAHRLARRHPGR